MELGDHSDPQAQGESHEKRHWILLSIVNLRQASSQWLHSISPKWHFMEKFWYISEEDVSGRQNVNFNYKV